MNADEMNSAVSMIWLLASRVSIFVYGATPTLRSNYTKNTMQHINTLVKLGCGRLAAVQQKHRELIIWYGPPIEELRALWPQLKEKFDTDGVREEQLERYKRWRALMDENVEQAARRENWRSERDKVVEQRMEG